MIIVNNYNDMINFKSNITQKLLDYFFVNKKSSNYVNELARILELDPGNLFRKLQELEKEGILISEMKGNQKYYSLNSKYPLLSEYKKLYDKKYGFLNDLKKYLKKIKGLKKAFIFGSFVKGNFSPDSDIDLCLVGDHDYESVSPIILSLEKRLGREMSVVDFGTKEFDKKNKNGDEFIKNILSSKIIELI